MGAECNYLTIDMGKYDLIRYELTCARSDLVDWHGINLD